MTLKGLENRCALIYIYMGQNASTGSMLCPKFFATYRGVRGLKMFVDLLSFESRVALFEIQDGGLNMAAERWLPPHEFKVLLYNFVPFQPIYI